MRKSAAPDDQTVAMMGREGEGRKGKPGQGKGREGKGRAGQGRGEEVLLQRAVDGWIRASALKCSSFSLTLFLPFHLRQDFPAKVSLLATSCCLSFGFIYFKLEAFGLGFPSLGEASCQALFTHYHFL